MMPLMHRIQAEYICENTKRKNKSHFFYFDRIIARFSLELPLYTIADELDKMKIKNTCIEKAIAKDSMSLAMKFDDSYSQK